MYNNILCSKMLFEKTENMNTGNRLGVTDW